MKKGNQTLAEFVPPGLLRKVQEYVFGMTVWIPPKRAAAPPRVTLHRNIIKSYRRTGSISETARCLKCDRGTVRRVLSRKPGGES